jgi:hypothetical protein
MPKITINGSAVVGIGTDDVANPDESMRMVEPEVYFAEKMAYYHRMGMMKKHRAIVSDLRKESFDFHTIRNHVAVFNKKSVMDACAAMVPEFRMVPYEIRAEDFDRDRHVIIRPIGHVKGSEPTGFLVIQRRPHPNIAWADSLSVSPWLWIHGPYLYLHRSARNRNQIPVELRRVAGQLWWRFSRHTIPHMIREGLAVDADITLQHNPTRFPKIDRDELERC